MSFFSWWKSPEAEKNIQTQEKAPEVRKFNQQNQSLDSNLWQSYISHTGSKSNVDPLQSASPITQPSSSSYINAPLIYDPNITPLQSSSMQPGIAPNTSQTKTASNSSSKPIQGTMVSKPPLLNNPPVASKPFNIIPIAILILATLLVFNTSSIQTTASILFVTVVMASSVYFSQKLGTGIALAGGILIGQFWSSLKFSIYWFPVFCLLIGLSTVVINLWKPKTSHEKNVLAMDPSHQWLSLLLHGIIKHASPYPVPQFDIGGTLPRFTTRDTKILSEGHGVSMVVDFEYKADVDTKIEIEIPMEIPMIGTWRVPIMVSSPHIAGTVNIDIRNINQIQKDQSSVKIFALAFAFEPIKEIHIGKLHISVASQFSLLQYVPLIKDQMKKGINLGLAPGTRRIMVFDSSFGTLGTFNLPANQDWEVHSLLKKAHIQEPQPETLQVPILDLAHTQPPSGESSNEPRYDLSASMMFAPNEESNILGITELEADIPPELEPGEAKEMEVVSGDARYPMIRF